MANEHTHNYQNATEIKNPIGVSSDGKRAVYSIEEHSFCSCGDLNKVSKGVREE